MSGIIQFHERSRDQKRHKDIGLDYRSGKDMPLRDALKLMSRELQQLAEKTQPVEPVCAERLLRMSAWLRKVTGEAK